MGHFLFILIPFVLPPISLLPFRRFGDVFRLWGFCLKRKDNSFLVIVSVAMYNVLKIPRGCNEDGQKRQTCICCGI